MRTATMIICALVLAGCSSTPRWLENRVACTVDGKEAYLVSKWGAVGIAAQIAEADARVMCRR